MRNDVSKSQGRTEGGELWPAEELLPLVYEELRRIAAQKMAQQAPGQTLQPTALVHEAWLRLGADAQPAWENQAHFFAAAAEAGANNMSGPTWQLSENSQAETEALNKAATNARSKADALAAAEGVAVGQVLILDETSTSPISPVYDQSTASGAATPSVSPPPVNPQNIDVTASVSVTYQIKR